MLGDLERGSHRSSHRSAAVHKLPISPLTTKTIIFLGSDDKGLHRNCREPTKMMVLVGTGRLDPFQTHLAAVAPRQFQPVIEVRKRQNALEAIQSTGNYLGLLHLLCSMKR